MFALPNFMLLAQAPADPPSLFQVVLILLLVGLVGLGSLAAIVFGIVYAIAKKRPGVALASVLLPVAALVGIGLLGMVRYGSQSSGHIGGNGPVQVSWTSVPPVPAVPAMPAMPTMGLVGAAVDSPNPLAIDPDLFVWTGAIFLFVCGGLYFAFSGKREKCDATNGTRRFGWGKAILGAVVVIVLLKYTTFTVWHGAHQQARWKTTQAIEARDQALEARRQIEEGTSVPPISAAPAMPAMPSAVQFQQVASTGQITTVAKIVLVLLVCLGLAAMFRKGSSCNGGRRGWAKPLAMMLLIVVAAHYLMVGARYAARQQQGRIRQDRDIARLQIEEAKRIADTAADQAAAAQIEGKNFQQMLEQVTKPRIELGTDGAKVTIDAESKPTPTVAAEAGNSKVVVPISAATQESLARSVARLEQMVEQVGEMADQVSDAGTLLGKAMVALNDRLDTRSKTEAAPAPQAEMKPAVALELPAPVKPVVTPDVMAAPVKAPAGEIVIGEEEQNTVVVKIDRHLLDRSGLSFEKLKEELSREGMWHGKVVRFDENKLQITARGNLAGDYLPRLKSTLVTTKGQFGQSIHLSDLAEVETAGAMALAPIKNPARPAWVDEQPRQVGNVRRDVVATEEYSSREECARAADVLLLLKTYEHLSQLLGNPRSEQLPPSLTFYTETGAIAADGEMIYERHGNYGEWLDYRWKMLADMGVGIDFVRRELVPDHGEYYETVERSAGPMNKLYTRMEFRPNVDQELLRRWNELRRGERFAVVGAGAGSVLGLLGLAFGLLKVDTLTKGYYTKRLFLGVPAAIIGGLTLLFAAM